MDFEGRKRWKGDGRELLIYLLLLRVKEGSVGLDVEVKPKIREKEGGNRLRKEWRERKERN